MNSQNYVGQDISHGLEMVPVLTVSGEEYPTFQYTPENVQGPGCEIDPSELTIPGCSCDSVSCPADSCSCLLSYGQTYDCQGRLLDKDSATDTDYCKPVFECNALCGCSELCCNRVVQRGLEVKLEVYLTGKTGFGVRALKPIPKGTFVCEYAGEVIGFKEARHRQSAQGPKDNNYIIAVCEHAGQGPVSKTFVDPALMGNVGRFLNHSCQPNLFMVPVRIHSMVPRLALFTGRDVKTMEELTFDYSGDYSNQPAVERLAQSGTGTVTQRKPCHCGAQNCALFLPLDSSILDN